MDSFLNNIILPGRVSYTAETLPSPPLIFVAGVPCLKVGSGSAVAMYLHGNAEDLGTAWRFATALAERLNCTLYVPEYRGYGIHRGPTSPSHTVSDVCRVLKTVAQHHRTPVHIIGYSIGTAVACAAAGKYPSYAASITLVAPMHSIQALVEHYTMSKEFAKYIAGGHIFNSVKWLQQIGSNKRVFIVHGDKDSVVPYHNSVRIIKELGSDRVDMLTIFGGGHTIDWDTDMLDAIARWWNAHVTF
jgi:pimeloyl-ACP methyl ester carboxylesterase